MSGPLRWKDQGSEADPALREVVRYAQQLGPDEAQLAALTERVRARLPAADASAAASPSVAPLAWKVAALGLCVVLGGFACWLALSGRSRPAQAPAELGRPAVAVRGAEPAAAELSRQVVQESARGAEPAADAGAAATPETAGAHVRHRLAKLRRSAQPPQPARAQPVDSGVDEMALLHSARQLVRSDVAGALSVVREHERRYPEGTFREEREALLVELLWRTGQRAEGRARLAAFTQRYPNSAYSARIRRWLSAGESAQPAPVESADQPVR